MNQEEADEVISQRMLSFTSQEVNEYLAALMVICGHLPDSVPVAFALAYCLGSRGFDQPDTGEFEALKRYVEAARAGGVGTAEAAEELGRRYRAEDARERGLS